MDDRIVLDRESFEALAVDTRVRILKSLKERRKTLTEIAKEQKMSVSGIKEHLANLEKVGLIEKMDDGHKWKYYELTTKGRDIIGPKEIRVWILLSISTFALIASMFLIFLAPMAGPMSAEAPQDHLAAQTEGGVVTTSAEEPGMGANKDYYARVPSPLEAGEESEAESYDGEYNHTFGWANESNGTVVEEAGDMPPVNESADALPEVVGEEAKEDDSSYVAPPGEPEVESGEREGAVLDFTIPMAIAAISALAIMGCLGILARNRLRVTSP